MSDEHCTHWSASEYLVSFFLTLYQGSGKGTQCSKLQVDYGITPISSGDLLRRVVHNSSSNQQLSALIKAQMTSGGLVADDLVLQLIRQTLANLETGWVLDGFPRTVQQAIALDALLGELSQSLTAIFYLQVSEHAIYDRIKDRLVHLPSGRVYSESFNPPKVGGLDDVTAEPLTKRDDDNLETIRARLRRFYESSAPLLHFYAKENRLVTVDSPTSAIGYVKIKEHLDGLRTTEGRNV